MKLRKLLLATLLITSMSLANSSTPVRATAQNNTVELNLSYDFEVSGETRRMSFIILFPGNIAGRQKILSTRYSPQPSRIFYENENAYAEFVFNKPDRQIKIEINIIAELQRYDLLTAMDKSERDFSEGSSFEDFLKHERYIEKDDDQIRHVAQSIEGRTEINTVRNIYNYVIDNMQYVIDDVENSGALKALEQKRGDCTEYADLFVALCRAKNIPARVVSGYAVRFDDVLPIHNWAEVYMQSYGWVPFDPSGGDVENLTLRSRAFSRLRPIYIYLSHIRNDQILRNYQFGLYRHWGGKVVFKNSAKFRPHVPNG